MKAWCALAGATVSIHLLTSCLAPNSYGLHVFGDVLQSGLLLCCYLFTLPNQVGANRAAAFWTLISAGFALWLLNQTLWTFFEIVLEKSPAPGFWGDVVLFLHPIPIMMAFTCRRLTRATLITAASILVFWIYAYTSFVATWQYVIFDETLYARNFNIVYGAANISVIIFAALCSWFSAGEWRAVYQQFLGAASIYAGASYIASSAIDQGKYYTGSLYDIPLICSFFWFAGATLTGNRVKGAAMFQDENVFWQRWIPAGAFAGIVGAAVLTSINSAIPSFVLQLRLWLAGVAIVILSLLGLLLACGKKDLRAAQPQF
jgi:hypothetical protein